MILVIWIAPFIRETSKEVNMVLGFNSVKECRLYSKRFLGILRRTSSFIVMKPLKNDELKIVNIELYTLEYKKNGITELHNSVY